MILKRVTLENYCQHVNRTVEIQGNLIAIVGSNGKGKSNFLGAIQFALTGEQPGKTKDSLVHWGAKDGKVTLEFELDGKPGRIVRPILSPKVVIEYDGTEVTGITAVAKALEERLGIDKDLVKQSVFVRQKEIDTIISAKTDKRDREVAFQKLIGLDAARIHKNLTDWMYQAAKPVNYDIQITEAEQRLGELEARITGLESEVRDAQAKLDEAGKPDDSGSERTRKAIAAVTSVIAAHGYLHTCKMAESKAAADLKAAKSAVADVGVNPNVDLATKAQENQVLQEEMAKDEAVKQATARRDTLAWQVGEREKALAELATKPHPTDEEIQKLEADLVTLQESIAAENAALSSHQKALGALNGGETACPVCGKPLDGDTVAKLQQELGEIRTKLADLSTLAEGKRSQIAQRRSVKSSWDAESTRISATLETERQSLARAEADLAALPKAEVDGAVANQMLERNREAIAAQKAFDEKAAGRKAVLQDAEIRAKAAAESVKAAEADLVRCETAAKAELGIPAAEEVAARDWTADKANLEGLVAAADRKRQEVQALQVGLARATATRDEAVKTLETTRQTVESLKAQQAKQDVLAKRLKVLENVRDWFNYTNGPRVLVNQVLDAVTDDVNRFLGNFTAPFVVTPNHEQLGFFVEFTDGRDRPEDPVGTEALSGGECVQLAVAFRLAVYVMFAGKLGLLSLDEPTAYLDEGNVDRFGILLAKVRDLARNMNTQVLMATHERAVIPHMDSVIDLN